MIKVNSLEEYANLVLFKNYCDSMRNSENCENCVITSLCDCCSECPGSMNIEYYHEGNE